MKVSPIVGAPVLLYSIWDEVKVRHETSALGLSGGGRNESNYTDTWNEMKWKGYHNDPDLGHVAGNYEPIVHEEMLYASDHRQPKASGFRERDAHAEELIDVSLHLLMEEDLRAYEIDQIRAEFGDMQGPSIR